MIKIRIFSQRSSSASWSVDGTLQIIATSLLELKSIRDSNYFFLAVGEENRDVIFYAFDKLNIMMANTVYRMIRTFVFMLQKIKSKLEKTIYRQSDLTNVEKMKIDGIEIQIKYRQLVTKARQQE